MPHCHRRDRIVLALLLGSLVGELGACSRLNTPLTPIALSSRYTDEQPALSGDGRLLAFVSNRNGSHDLVLYDLQQQQLIPLPHLNRNDAIAESPSLSRTGRYLVYIASDRGKPDLEVYDRVTRRVEVLTSTYRGWVRHPSISPDGRYIAFESGRRGQWDIEVIDRGPTIELDLPNGSPVSPSPVPSP